MRRWKLWAESTAASDLENRGYSVEPIAEDLISGMERLVRLIQQQREKKEKDSIRPLIGLVDQVYRQLESVHLSYITHFLGYRGSATGLDPPSLMELKNQLIHDSALTEPDRAKLVALYRQFRPIRDLIEWRASSAIGRFIWAAYDYLGLSRSQINTKQVTNTARIDLLSQLKSRRVDRRVMIELFDEALADLRIRFQAATDAYYDLKSELALETELVPARVSDATAHVFLGGTRPESNVPDNTALERTTGAASQ